MAEDIQDESPKTDAQQPPPADSMLRLIFVLTAVATVSATVLALADRYTKDRIAKVRARAKLGGIARTLPRCDNNPAKDTVQVADEKGKTFNVYRCKRGKGANQRTVAVAIEIDSSAGKHKPYSGLMVALVSLDVATGKVRGYKTKKGPEVGVLVLKHTETPGLGTKAEAYDFRKAFAGQDLVGADTTSKGRKWAVKKDNPALGFVDAISGATITSRAVTDLVHRALKLYHGNKHRILKGRAVQPVKRTWTPTPRPTPDPRRAATRRKRPKPNKRAVVKREHVQRVLPPCDNDPHADALAVKDPQGRPALVYRCLRKGKLVAVAIERDSRANAHQPYGGIVQVVVGVNARTGKVLSFDKRQVKEVGVFVLQQHETPDMGTEVFDYAFRKHFGGRDLTSKGTTSDGKQWTVNPEKGKKLGVVDVISGATVSSAALTELVKRALEVWVTSRAKVLAAPRPAPAMAPAMGARGR